jgi:chorismate mutase / prephenate dehydratase
VSQDPAIEELRVEIDRLDQELLRLLSDRVAVVLRVGERKKAAGLAIFDPKREQTMLDRLASQAASPLDRELVLTVFRTLIAECRRLEAGTRDG